MTTEIETAEARTQKLEGLGTRRKRVEDVRFTQGKGNYIDDFKMPGMLFGDFVRSPYGHARVKSINKEAALELPGVKAVLTADDLKPLKLALDADPRRRCPSRIGRRESAVSGPGGRVRRRRGSLCRGRCRRPGRGRIRGAAGAR